MPLTLAIAPHLVPVAIPTGVAMALVGLLFLLHIQFAAFQQGGAMLVTLFDFLGMVRKDERQTRFAHGMVKTMAVAFAFGGALAIFVVMILLTGLWSHFWVKLLRVMFWPLVVEAGAFVLEIGALYTLYVGWERLGRVRPLRVGLGLVLTIDLFVQMLAVNFVASYMLTPRPAFDLPLILLNPTLLPLEIHRLIGNVAFAGALVAIVGGWRVLRARTPEQRSYGDWMGAIGAVTAISFTALQPLVGWEYAKEIQLHAYASWYDMMLGGLSVAFLFQIFLLGLILTAGIFFFWRRVRTSGIRSPTLALCAVLSLGAWLLGSTPSSVAWTYEQVFAANANVPIWNGGLLIPFGQMIPWKLTALVAFTFVSIAAVSVFLREVSRGHLRWGEARRSQAVALITMGVAVSLIMALMGFIREDSRGPFLITNHMLVNQQQNFRPPSTTGPAQAGAPTQSSVILGGE
ncbi:MAG TPA: cytochrome ubiquinol oxidase subunit I [Candidatus Micrarchaeia archaeon]|nr:cytochrome ubiquinol oxidase subunit I [Candidatus Micrarchaeia archaeon]